MKKILKMISVILVAAFMFQVAMPAAFATEMESQKVSVIWEEVDETDRVAQQLAEFNGLIFFSYADEEIAYSAQMTPTNKVQFSYVLADVDKIYESSLYDIDEIRSIYGINTSDSNYELLNKTIIENILDFEVDSEITISQAPMTRGSSSLEGAILDAFGANYSGSVVGTAQKNYNGTTYYVRCTESQSTTYTTPETQWFAKETSSTAIIAWLGSGNWSWISLGTSLILTVVSMVITNGVLETVKNFTAERSDATLMHTRNVTVSGYSQTQYWAGWTRKMYFFKGDLGWTHDVNFYYDFKHSDFDNISFLMQKGFDNFINNMLIS